MKLNNTFLFPDAAEGTLTSTAPVKTVTSTVGSSSTAASKFKPQVAKEPPKEILAMNFDMDDAPKDMSGSTAHTEVTTIGKSGAEQRATEAASTATEEKQSEIKGEKKEEKIPSFLKASKEEVTTQKKDEKKEDAKVTDEPIGHKIAEKKASTDTFDYSSYAPQEVTYLKNMSREAREFTSKLLKEHKDLSKLKDSTYLQHENAFMLDPQYNQLQNQAQQAQIESSYWNQQLMACKAGKKVRMLTGYDKDGRLQQSEEMNPSDELEEKLRMCVHQTNNIGSNVRAQLNDYPAKYRNQVNNDLQIIKGVSKQKFAWVADPKLLDYSLTMRDGSEKTLKKIKEENTNYWPAYLRNHPAVEAFANVMVALAYQDAELREAQAGKSVAETKTKEVERGEPSSTSKPASMGDVIGGIREFDMKDAPDGL